MLPTAEPRPASMNASGDSPRPSAAGPAARFSPRPAAVEAWLLKVPLERPYKLSFGPVKEFETVLVRVTRQDGAEGYGEATLLTGYTDETIGETWARARQLVEAMAQPGFDAEAALAALDVSHPFLTTAFRTADEMAQGSPLLRLDRPARVPILGLLQGDTPQRIEAETEALLQAGYRTLKVKVGFDPGRDAEIVAFAQRAVAGRARLRLDANQGYSAGQACEFLSRLHGDHIELFEQPCAAGDWDAHMQALAVADRVGIPLMLDESIYSLREIEQAAALRAAAYVKVKLMKFNNLERLDAAIVRIGELGMRPVLGNGVANDLGCWMEACVAARRIDNAGEMNGFLKPRGRLFGEPLPFEDGAIVLQPGFVPRIDPAALDAFQVDRVGTRRISIG